MLNRSRLTWKVASEATDLTVDESGFALEGNEGLDEGGIAFSRRIEVAVVRGSAPSGFPDPLYGVELG
jgi:hypothetical protein